MTLRAIVDDIVMGAALTYQTAELADRAKFGLPYYLISLSLNILLTLMIVIRLALHIRNTRTALGGTGIGGLCKAIIAMFIESCVLYGVGSLLFIGLRSVGSPAATFLLPLLDQTQVRAFP